MKKVSGKYPFYLLLILSKSIIIQYYFQQENKMNTYFLWVFSKWF